MIYIVDQFSNALSFPLLLPYVFLFPLTCPDSLIQLLSSTQHSAFHVVKDEKKKVFTGK